MFEPLLYFVLTYSNNILGVPLSVSRILQLVVLFMLATSFFDKLLRNEKLVVVNNILPENQFLLLYFILLIFSSTIGIIYGSYNLPQLETLSLIYYGANPYLSRSIFEIIIIIFNIFYFVILPRHLIKTKIDFDYFFSVFKFFLIITLLVGYLDYIFAELGITDLVHRHIRDDVGVGGRFHGLAGEPRQAAVHMVFNFSMYILYCKYFRVKPRILILLLIVLALIFTKSMSLFVALIFFSLFLVIFRMIKFKYLILLAIIIFFMFKFENIQNYYTKLLVAWEIIESGIDLPYHLRIIKGEIYPIYDIIKKSLDFDLVPVIFGHGSGSVSAVNNIYIGDYLGARNPNAQIIRLLFESGILGTMVFVISMIWPIKYFTHNMDKKNKDLYLVTMIMILSVIFAVRSSIVFMYLGIITTFLHFNEKNIKN